MILRSVSALASTDVAAAAQQTVEAGMDGIELSIPVVAVTTAHEVRTTTKSQGAEPVRRVAPLLEESSRPVLAISASCTTHDLDSAVEIVEQILLGAVALGASCLNLRLPPLAAVAIQAGFDSYQGSLNFVHDLLRTVRSEVESSGAGLAIEAATDGILLSPVEVRELIDAANSPSFGVCVDPSRLEGIGRASDWILTLGPRLHSLRITADRGGSLASVEASGLGEAIRALRSIDFSGHIIVAAEATEQRTDPEGSAGWLKSLRAALGIELAP